MGILALNRLMMGQLPQTEIPSGDADGVLRAVDFLPRKYSRGLVQRPIPHTGVVPMRRSRPYASASFSSRS